MPPAAKNILGDGVEIVTAMLVTVIVVYWLEKLQERYVLE